MGTGLLASLNKNGSISPLILSIDRMKRRISGVAPEDPRQAAMQAALQATLPAALRAALQAAPETPAAAFVPPAADPEDYLNIKDQYGVLTSVSHLSSDQKAMLANRRNYLVRSEIALDVASCYCGGDYFEFGSSGLVTFRSFLGAFDIYHAHTQHFPDTKFYAFDIFGDPNIGSGAPAGEQQYFEAWRNPFDVAAPMASLEPYGELKDRCVIVPGYFQDTLSEEFKAKMRANNQKIGFAFLDVNTAYSYKIVFDWLIDVMNGEKMFIYLDEYFTDPPVPPLYDLFCAEAKKRFNMTSIYMRNAGSFGALFCLMPPPIAEYDRLFPYPITRP